MDAKDCEKFLASMAAVDAEFSKYRENMQAKVDGIRASLDGEKACSSALVGERAKLLISEKSLKRQQHLRTEYSQQVED